MLTWFYTILISFRPVVTEIHTLGAEEEYTLTCHTPIGPGDHVITWLATCGVHVMQGLWLDSREGAVHDQDVIHACTIQKELGALFGVTH